ncbi:MAG: VTT domain-containing protein [Oscillospiraceae bacterium]|nr:VTT domain-containing protein [Oscillospiraceae bacterium]
MFRDELSLDTLVNAAPGNLAAAAAVMLVLFALKSVSIVLYSGILYAASGLLFPLPMAIVVNLCGTAVMVSLPYLIGRKSGASMVEGIREKYPKVRQLHELQKRNNFIFSYGARIVRLPSDVVSLYMGASGVDYRAYLAGSMLGLLPHTVTYSIMGTSITDTSSPAFLISLGVEVAYVAVTAVVYALYAKRHAEQPGEEEPGHGQAD